jgi:hypothetical protein
MMNRPPTISLNLMPAFYHKHTGITYGEAYYFDPSHRAEVERTEGRFQHEAWGRHGVGSPDPQPSPNLFIQSIDLILRTQGAQWRFPEDACLESWGAPWAGLSIAEISRLDPREAAQHPVIDAVLDQYRELRRLYGDRADVFGLKSGWMTIHGPYTDAHQLRGQGLFIEMVTEPADARVIVDKAWEIELAVQGRIAEALGVRPRSLHIGDCSASLLSPRVYREVVLPVNQRLAAQFAGIGYHSCGPSTHLLADFATLTGLGSIQLGPGTDLTEAARLMPGVHLQPLIDPVPLRDGNPEEAGRMVRQVLEDTSPAPEVTLCVWSLDRETPVGNVAAVYEAVAQHGRG